MLSMIKSFGLNHFEKCFYYWNIWQKRKHILRVMLFFFRSTCMLVMPSLLFQRTKLFEVGPSLVLFNMLWLHAWLIWIYEIDEKLNVLERKKSSYDLVLTIVVKASCFVSQGWNCRVPCKTWVTHWLHVCSCYSRRN